MSTTTISTTLLESVNIVLANLGESPVNTLSGGALPQQVSLALNTIEEVSTDIQSKGWWFNQQTASAYNTTANVVIYPSNTGNDWSSSIPEEVRRYITIRSSRIAQTRLIGSEELQKFSYNEELVSLAILQQAHVRNSGGVLDFNDFPAELRGLGMDEVMFLQGNVEEKIGTLRLGGELANIAKTKAETELVEAQEELTDAQKATELQNAIKVAADAGLVTTQQALIAQQVLESVANVSNITADVALKGKQGSLVDAQATDVAADTTLKGKQGIKLDADTGLTTQQQALTAQQTLDVVADTELKGKQGSAIDADTALKTSQKTQLDAQTAIEATAEKAFFDAGGVDIGGSIKTYRDFAAEMRMMGFQEAQFQGTPAYKKIELIKDADKLRTATATETGSDATELLEVNKVMRFIGEPPVSALNSNSLASECVRLLRDTDKELQGRGWWFNTETDVELTANGSGQLVVPTDALSVELNEYATRIKTVGSTRYIYDLKDKSYTSWSGTVKAKVIYKRDLDDSPSKYLEYLSVRVAILLTELYPQSGIDIQRLPKLELELRAYFKDREFDEANYSVFDNYDTASRIGINRNYDLF
jgi:hypothetical protein